MGKKFCNFYSPFPKSRCIIARALTCVERGGMQPPSQHSARFAVETRWKKTCVVERPALFWIGSSQGLYNFKLGKEIILCLVLHFANPACFRSH